MDEFAFFMREEFEVFDYIGKEPLPVIKFDDMHVDHVIYVDRKRYDSELLRGQETAVAAYNQLAKDIGRCLFFMNGRLCKQNSRCLPLALVRYCTQAVMALPIEMIAPEAIVAENKVPSRMKIFATHRTVHVSKSLRMMYENSWAPVDINVFVSLDEETVVITFVRGRLTHIKSNSYSSKYPSLNALVEISSHG